MRVVKTDRGYIDMDHVLAVGEPYYWGQGLYGFDVILAFQDKARQYLYYAEDLGLVFHESKDGNAKDRILYRLREQRLNPFVALWKGEIEQERYDRLTHGNPDA